jgi:acyl dehydratase
MFDFETLSVGQILDDRMTITEAHVVLAAGIFGDLAPLHVDEEYAKTTPFGARLVHGTLVTGVMAGVFGKWLGPNARGYLEQNVRFVAPVYIGDTLTTRWEVVEKIPKEKLGGGIVKLRVECSTQTGTVVLTGDAALIVAVAASDRTAI